MTYSMFAEILVQTSDINNSLAEQLSWENLQSILVPFVLFVTGSSILVIDLFLGGWRQASRPGEKSALYFLALLGTVVAAALTCASFEITGTDGRGGTVFFEGALRVDTFTKTISLFILIGTFLTLMSAVDYLYRNGIEHGEFHCLVLYSAAAMVLFAESNNLIMLFLSLETLSMAVYTLVAMLRDEKRSVEGALKYFILGGFSTGFLLFGIAFLYGATGEIELSQMVQKTDPDPVLLLAGLAMVVTGLAFKVGAFPFHSWVPDAYEGAPAVVTGFMAVTVKVSSFAVLLRWLVNLGSEGNAEAHDFLLSVLPLLAGATMIFGNVVALVQNNVKRMLAYSAIGHTGYLLIGVVAGLSDDRQHFGTAAVTFYLLPYSLMTLGAFTLLNFMDRNGKDRELFSDYRGLAQERPVLALGLLIILVSYAGIPPTAGFWAKLFIFREAVETGHWVLAVTGILTSIVSIYYYLRLVVNFYMQSSAPEDIGSPSESRLASALVVGTAAVVIVLIGLFPNALYELSQHSAEALSVAK